MTRLCHLYSVDPVLAWNALCSIELTSCYRYCLIEATVKKKFYETSLHARMLAYVGLHL